MRSIFASLVLSVIAIGAIPAAQVRAQTGHLSASQTCHPKPDAKTQRVAQVIDGQTLRLEDGTIVRLIGALPPFPRRGQALRAASLAEQARIALQKASRGRQVLLAFTGRKEDRYGRKLAHVWVLGAGQSAPRQAMTWLQAELIRTGLARVYSFPDNRACIRQLLLLEARARRQRLGIWRTRFAFAVRDAAKPRALLRHANRFEIIEGQIAKVGRTRKWTFLNFSDNWKRDFTIMVPARARKSFARAGIDLQSLQGRRVRARGWLEVWNGPLLKLSHPEQLEVLPRRNELAVTSATTGAGIDSLLPDLPKPIQAKPRAGSR